VCALLFACWTAYLPGQPQTTASSPPRLRTLNDTYDAPRVTTADAWRSRAAYLREHVLASAGLLPLPERTPLRPVVFGGATHDDYSVSKVYFESLPGFFVTGNLYRPAGAGPFPAILSPHGHWAYGRLENTDVVSGPGRAIGLARQGFVVFAYDMVGYGDSQQIPHTFGGRREALWGLSLSGLQLWDSIRALDFLESLPFVKRDAIGMTGESGGGTQTFLLAAVDDRVRVAAPVNMISLHMQGGCLCENMPALRLDTTNVELAATIAPRPLLMVSATGDWTANTLEQEFPAVRSIYDVLGARDKVQAVRFQAEHNYNRDSREAMYAWMARWLQDAPADARRPERLFTVDSPADLLVFHRRSLPDTAVTPEQLTTQWIEAAKRQLPAMPLDLRVRLLRHMTGVPPAEVVPARGPSRVVLIVGSSPGVTEAVRKAGYEVRTVALSRQAAEAASKVRHVDTYNRTETAQDVVELTDALRATPGAAIVAAGNAAAATLLATAVAPIRFAVVDVSGLALSTDDGWLEKAYVPGAQRAGGMQTVLEAGGARLVVHGGGDRFGAGGEHVKAATLSPAEIVAALRSAR
jgi:hypothetical protein